MRLCITTNLYLKMQSAIAVSCTLKAFRNLGTLIEFLLFGSHIYPDDILPDDTPSTDV